jgi:hypothetical protein
MRFAWRCLQVLQAEELRLHLALKNSSGEKGVEDRVLDYLLGEEAAASDAQGSEWKGAHAENGEGSSLPLLASAGQLVRLWRVAGQVSS